LWLLGVHTCTWWLCRLLRCTCIVTTAERDIHVRLTSRQASDEATAGAHQPRQLSGSLTGRLAGSTDNFGSAFERTRHQSTAFTVSHHLRPCQADTSMGWPGDRRLCRQGGGEHRGLPTKYSVPAGSRVGSAALRHTRAGHPNARAIRCELFQHSNTLRDDPHDHQDDQHGHHLASTLFGPITMARILHDVRRFVSPCWINCSN